jgi:hypothetical protein
LRQSNDPGVALNDKPGTIINRKSKIVNPPSLLKNSLLEGRQQMILGDPLTSRAVSIDNVRAIP